MQYVQLTVELIAKAIQLFSGNKITEKTAKKITKLLAQDDDVDKYHFCETICAKSKNPCMKKVDDDGMFCHVHDLERKCHGTTKKGVRCASVAKVGEDYCWHHRDAEEDNSQNKTKKNIKTSAKKTTKKQLTKEQIEHNARAMAKFLSHGNVDQEDKMYENFCKNKQKKRKFVTVEDVESEEENEDSSEEENEDSSEEENEDSSEEEKHSKKKSKNSKKESKKSKRIIPEDDIIVSEEDDESKIQLSPNAINVKSALNVPSIKNSGWTVHPNNDKLEYCTSLMINRKCIVKKRGTNMFVDLCSLEILRGEGGEAPEMNVIERSIISKMKLVRLSELERKDLYGTESEDDDDNIPMVQKTHESSEGSLEEDHTERDGDDEQSSSEEESSEDENVPQPNLTCTEIERMLDRITISD